MHAHKTLNNSDKNKQRDMARLRGEVLPALYRDNLVKDSFAEPLWTMRVGVWMVVRRW